MTLSGTRHPRLRTAVAILVVAPALCASGAASAGELVVPCKDPIPGSYIVGLRDGFVAADSFGAASAPALRQLGTELALLYGGQAKTLYRYGAPGFSMDLPEDAVRRLVHDPRVLFVERDCPIYPSSVQTSAPWSLDRIDQSFLPLNSTYTFNEDGSGVNIYVIDTGVSPNSELGSRLEPGRNFVPGLDPADTDDCWSTSGHGTAVAAMAAGATYGVAKGANVHPLRIFGCTLTPNTSYTSLARDAVDWMIQHHVKPAVANMSFSLSICEGSGCSGTSSMETSIQAAFDAGIVMVASANNQNQNACNSTPARIPDVITVGAVDALGQRATFPDGGNSNFGPCVDLWAPGKDTPSITNLGLPFNFGRTSAAAPLVSGAAALYLQTNPLDGPPAVASHVTGHATPGVLVGSTLGTGSPNLLLFAKPAHACISWDCTRAARTCLFKMSCSRMPFGLGQFSLDFGDGTSFFGTSPTVVHTYPAQGTYDFGLTLVPANAAPDGAGACLNANGGIVPGCSASGLVPWQ